MIRTPFIVIDGKLYRWKDILELRRALAARCRAFRKYLVSGVSPENISS